jgi:hypothetical protein
MSHTFDFERYWLAKFSDCLDEVAGEKVRQQVMAGSQALNGDSDRREVIAWSREAMLRLESLVDDENQRIAIMTSCACQYPREDLADVKRVYAQTGDLERAHAMLQERFETFLRETLQVPEWIADEVIARGWGLAGVRQGNAIIATKIPKSGFLVEYMRESDPQVKRQIYCHCPRVRDALKLGESLPATYCYCGAGFYKGIWEEILGKPVRVELLESVLQGDEVCKVAVHLPLED